jgi:hypothetical protein
MLRYELERIDWVMTVCGDADRLADYITLLGRERKERDGRKEKEGEGREDKERGEKEGTEKGGERRGMRMEEKE